MPITLRGIKFCSSFTASGTLNFFGQGWPYHKYYRLTPGFSFKNSTFIAKTTTADYRAGNMPLDKMLRPKEFRPKCIYVDFLKGITLNAVNLSGPGTQELLQTGAWQKIAKPFFLSFMAVSATKNERLKELKKFCVSIGQTEFKSKFGLELNLSCPNTEHDQKNLIAEAIEIITAADSILTNVPLIIKISVLIDPLTVEKIIINSPCDAIDVSNAIPWGTIPDEINWKNLFNSTTSPLHMFDGGGLSGKPLLPLVTYWIKKARMLGIKAPIIGGGGILCKKDVEIMKHSGADAISLGSVTILRPWRVQSIINHANKILEE